MSRIGGRRLRGGWRSRLVSLLIVLAATACPLSGAAGSQPAGAANAEGSSPSPHAYLAGALAILQNRDVFTARVDWTVERHRLLSTLDRRPTLSLARELIGQALADLNDGHGQLHPPGGAQTPASTALPIVPHGRMLPGRVGYLLLPAVSGNPDSAVAAAYGARGEELVRLLASRGADRWVVDLRWNTGGDLYPMLVAIGALLEHGRVMGFQPVGGRRTWITYDGDAFFEDGVRIMGASLPEPSLPTRPRIALLTSGQTASSGEAVLISLRGQRGVRSIGQPTFGVPNAPTTVPFADGYELEYSAEADVDRSGRVYNGPIAPGEDVAVPKTFVAQDLEMQAALRWLRPAQQPFRRRILFSVALTLIALVACGLAGTAVRRRRMSA